MATDSSRPGAPLNHYRAARSAASCRRAERASVFPGRSRLPCQNDAAERRRTDWTRLAVAGIWRPSRAGDVFGPAVIAPTKYTELTEIDVQMAAAERRQQWSQIPRPSRRCDDSDSDRNRD